MVWSITKDRGREQGNPPCVRCRHFRSVVNYTCDAFPQGIPMEIWSGRNQHNEPFPGDNNIRFELRVLQSTAITTLV